MKALDVRMAILALAQSELATWNSLTAYMQRLRVVNYFATLGVKLGPHDHPQWCGAFAFGMVERIADIGLRWKLGQGIIGPYGLPATKNPLIADIGYHDHPFQHHTLVSGRTGVDGESVSTIEGNAPGITAHTHHLAAPGRTFYSIEPLLKGFDT